MPQTQTQDNFDADVALVKRAIESLRTSGAEEATRIEATISDPVARKLVEWIILRANNNGANFPRYAAFIAANPSWPGVALFRRRAEAALWVEDVGATQVLSFFTGCPPQTAKGRLVLARALTEQGDTDGARQQVRQAWRSDPMPADMENQVLESYPELLTRADHKARMEKSLYAADNETAIRAARRLGGADLAIADARVALAGRGTDAKKMLEAVPPEAHNDAGYIFAYVQVLLRENKIAEAAKVMLAAPRNVAEIYDPEQWWIERQVLSRKLLDSGDARSAYLVVRDAAEPTKDGSRVERHFMAGWIALRFLHDPGAAARHFARIQEVSIHPTSLARSHYWLGRAAEAAHRPDEARAEYEAAARVSTAYYGQLARARLRFGALALASAHATPDETTSVKRLELVRALEILYALNERTFVVPIMTVLGQKLDAVGELSALGGMAEEHQDPRGMLQLGSAALARGLAVDSFAFPIVGVPDYSPIGPDLERAVLFAIIRQESAFNPDSLSSANAVGLMQLTPVTARDVCTRFKCTFDLNRLKSDQPYNLQLGAAELGGLIQYYGGNYILAFAAYNAGRGRVKEWIKQFGDPRDLRVDPIDWVERIPLTETRNYVHRVMENMQVYRVRFNATAPLTIEADLRRGTSTH
ncbi:MAG: lytic transglycosylase domain-containing protein [Xanthobacteraceae bacterium]|nr:lytic transglycosylase domain-containing protein [Xanthobacteraceae bacterium]